MTLIPVEAEEFPSCSKLLHNDFETQTQPQTPPHLQTQNALQLLPYTNKISQEINARPANMAPEEVPYDDAHARDGSNHFTPNQFQFISSAELQVAESRIRAELLDGSRLKIQHRAAQDHLRAQLDESHLKNQRLTDELNSHLPNSHLAELQLAELRLSSRHLIYALAVESLVLVGVIYLLLNEYKRF